jgi:hypothetical protein
LKEDAIVRGRRQLLRSWHRGLLQQATTTSAIVSSAEPLLVVEPAPAAQMFTAACPRKISCDTAQVRFHQIEGHSGLHIEVE